MKAAKLGVIFLVSVMALATAGAGYALWFEDLSIDSTIITGNFKIGIRDDGTGDPGPHYLAGGELHPIQSPIDGTIDDNHAPGDNSEGKNVASTISTQGTPYFLFGGSEYYYDIIETVDNAYPWYASSMNITFANGGTVPAKIKDGYFLSMLDPDGLMDFIVFCGADIYIDGVYQGSTTDLSELEYFQLDPEQTLTLDISFYFNEYFGVEVMPQGASLSFKYSIEWAQWNEVSGTSIWTP